MERTRITFKCAATDNCSYKLNVLAFFVHFKFNTLLFTGICFVITTTWYNRGLLQ